MPDIERYIRLKSSRQILSLEGRRARTDHVHVANFSQDLYELNYRLQRTFMGKRWGHDFVGGTALCVLVEG